MAELDDSIMKNARQSQHISPVFPHEAAQDAQVMSQRGHCQKTLKNAAHSLSVFSLSLLLVACGGGGGSTPANNTAVPKAQAVLAYVPVALTAPSYAADSAELAAWNYLQQSRVQCGFGAMVQNRQLDAAAQAHAAYLSTSSVTGEVSVTGHEESSAAAGKYTGSMPWDRAQYQSYGSEVAEILDAETWTYSAVSAPLLPTLSQRGLKSMRHLINTVYHLSSAMYQGSEVGFGVSLQSIDSAGVRRDEYRFGSLNGFHRTDAQIQLGIGSLATFPCEGSTGIATSFTPSDERPNPLPEMTLVSQKVGPPIYLKVDAGQKLVLHTSSVSKAGVPVATRVLTQANDPAKKIGAHEVFVIPSAELATYSEYQINLTGTVDGKPFSRTFTMATGGGA